MRLTVAVVYSSYRSMILDDSEPHDFSDYYSGFLPSLIPRPVRREEGISHWTFHKVTRTAVRDTCTLNMQASGEQVNVSLVKIQGRWCILLGLKKKERGVPDLRGLDVAAAA